MFSILVCKGFKDIEKREKNKSYKSKEEENNDYLRRWVYGSIALGGIKLAIGNFTIGYRVHEMDWYELTHKFNCTVTDIDDGVEEYVSPDNSFYIFRVYRLVDNFNEVVDLVGKAIRKLKLKSYKFSEFYSSMTKLKNQLITDDNFTKGRVICINPKGTDLEIDKTYRVIDENELSYCIKKSHYNLGWYGKDRFKV